MENLITKSKQTVGDIKASIIAKIKTFSDKELLEEAAKHKAADIIDHERWMLANDAFADEIKLRSSEKDQRLNLIDKLIKQGFSPEDAKKKVDGE